MAAAEAFVPGLGAILAFRSRPYGGTPYARYAGARQMKLTDDEIAAITRPILFTDPEGEQFWPGQPTALYERLPGPDEAIVRFHATEGADLHCEPAANGIRNERIFAWLDEVVPGD